MCPALAGVSLRRARFTQSILSTSSATRWFLAASILFAGQAAAEVGDEPPDWRACARADAPRECRGDEQAALALLRRFWTKMPWSARKHCIADAAPTKRTYVALTVCLEPSLKVLEGGPDALRAYWEDMGVASEFYK